MILKRRRHDQRGITVVELATTVMILSIVIAAAGSTLVSSQNTTALAASESSAVDVARTSAYQIQRDIRNATWIAQCTPTGYCLRMLAQIPGGTLDYVQYRGVQASPPGGPTSIYRDSKCTDATFTVCQVSNPLITNLKNQAQSVPIFACPPNITLGRIDVDLVVTPLSSASSGTLTVQTSARVRNVNYPFC